MKSTFQTTFIEKGTEPQNTFIGSIPSTNEPYSSTCILGLIRVWYLEFMLILCQ